MRPKVDWYKTDPDGCCTINLSTLRQDYGEAKIYQAWIPTWLLSERLWEDVGGPSYDWSCFDKLSIFPPIKIALNTHLELGVSYIHTLRILDGNHRVRFWRLCGFTEVPAWCFDYR